MRYALVKEGEILEFRAYEPNINQDTLPQGKPRMLPIEVVQDVYDPVSQILEGPTYQIEEKKVVERFTGRPKNSNEISQMIQKKSEEIADEFTRLYCSPITYSVGGQSYVFHADIEARENITGVLQMYREAELLGLTLPDQRSWTPYEASDPITISRAQLAGLGISIGARKDALYTIKKTRQKALFALTNPVEIDAIDPLTGWDI